MSASLALCNPDALVMSTQQKSTVHNDAQRHTSQPTKTRQEKKEIYAAKQQKMRDCVSALAQRIVNLACNDDANSEAAKAGQGSRLIATFALPTRVTIKGDDGSEYTQPQAPPEMTHIIAKPDDDIEADGMPIVMALQGPLDREHNPCPEKLPDGKTAITLANEMLAGVDDLMVSLEFARTSSKFPGVTGLFNVRVVWDHVAYMAQRERAKAARIAKARPAPTPTRSLEEYEQEDKPDPDGWATVPARRKRK